MHDTKTLITGSNGYIGLRLAKALLKSTDQSFLLWLHAKDKTEFQQKQDALKSKLTAPNNRLTYSCGDLAQDDAFSSVDPLQIETIIHSAAVTRFNVDAETARLVNFEGTQRVLNLARQCPHLKQLVFISTIYASGLTPGNIAEVTFDGKDGFSNHYEQSKWASENILVSQYNDLPWKICRVATVIADDDSGVVSQQNAFHNTLKLFYYGLLSVIPGNAETPLYFVTGDFAIKALLDLLLNPTLQTIYHVCHTKDESLKLGQLLDIAFKTFENDKTFKARRILKPLYCDNRSFNLLAEGVSTFGQGILNQAVSSVAPFAPQLFIDKDIKNERLVSAINNYQAPHAHDFIARTCQYLVQTKWGKEVQIAVS